MRRLLALVLIGLALVAATGCGDDDTQRVRTQVERALGVDKLRDRIEELKQDADRLRQQANELGRRVREVLASIGKTVPEASLPAPRARNLERQDAVAKYLTKVLQSVDGYWTKTLTASGIAAPRVSYLWIPPGRAARTGCQTVADDSAAFYCPNDDTIYVAEKLAADLYQGIADNFPGERAGAGNAVGAFGVAYVLAHEYAHNIQSELGFYQLQDPSQGVEPFELQADCMAGLWGNAVYHEGLYDQQDVRDAISTAQAAGDFDYGNPQHHGTPAERRTAWLAGFRSGDPANCEAYVPGT